MEVAPWHDGNVVEVQSLLCDSWRQKKSIAEKKTQKKNPEIRRSTQEFNAPTRYSLVFLDLKMHAKNDFAIFVEKKLHAALVVETSIKKCRAKKMRN